MSSSDESIDDLSSLNGLPFPNYLLPLRLMTEEEEHQVRVEFFTNERSIKERLQLYFIKNKRSSLYIRVFNIFIKLLSCFFYILRVTYDDPRRTEGCDCEHIFNATWLVPNTSDLPDHSVVAWNLIGFVNRNDGLWVIQIVVALISVSHFCLITYLGFKGSIYHSLLSSNCFLELLTSVPLVSTIFYPSKLKCLFIPAFLNCWLAKKQLEECFGDINRVFLRNSSKVTHEVIKVISTTFCLIFTSTCGIQHLQRGGYKHLTLFESLYLVVVTFSTVGYGDYRPDIWPSQVFMIIMILVGIIVLPAQLEKLVYAWMEKKKLGATYSRNRAQAEKHVVLCTTALHSDTIMDFLNEFYAHPKLQDFYVCLLSPCELDSTMKMILQVPIWAEQVMFIQGSALKYKDLQRCRMQEAEACFILAPINYNDRNAADQHTIMRSWAVKDFAPKCPQYVQLYRPENKFHVIFAEHVVCEDEFKYALLANNAVIPGISTLVTLLIHTSRGKEGQTSSEPWHRLYGKCSGNEVYHIYLGESQFFKEYEAKSFTYASFHAHRKYGVGLVAIRPENGVIQLNPGPRHLLKASDTCFYLSITKEEHSTFKITNSSDEKENKLRSSIKESALFSNSSSKFDELDLKRDSSFSRRSFKASSTNNDEVAAVSGYSSPDARKLLSNKVVKKFDYSFSVKMKNATQPADSPTEQPQMTNSAVTNTTVVSLGKEPSLKLAVPSSTQTNGPPTSMGFNRSPRASIAPVPDYVNDFFIKIESVDEPDDNREFEEMDYYKGYPPIMPYIGTATCLCHLMRRKREICCLQLMSPCDHCPHRNTHEYPWHRHTPSVLLCCDNDNFLGLFNFIVPLRSHWRSRRSLKPIILVLKNKPDSYFLEAISYFPLTYWMMGSGDCLDDLLKAGITLADCIVMVNKETTNSAEEESLSDCNTIVSVQTIYKLFPHIRIITELSQSSNMRFTLFSPDDIYALNMSKVEKKERYEGSHISYIFRLPFAAGNVFSASMLDTLLYQAFVKSYLIKFVRLLLGLDQAVGSGHLTCCHIKPEDLWLRTYGRLYQKLCTSTCEIPIGLYRTIKRDATDASTNISMNLIKHNRYIRDDMNLDKEKIVDMIKCRMLHLGLCIDDYENFVQQEIRNKCNSLSFVIINPNHELPLVEGDVIYLLRPSSLSDKASPLIDERNTLELKKSRSSASMHQGGSIRRNKSKSNSLYNINNNNSLSNKQCQNSPVRSKCTLNRNSSRSMYGSNSRFNGHQLYNSISRNRSPKNNRFYLDTPQTSIEREDSDVFQAPEKAYDTRKLSVFSQC